MPDRWWVVMALQEWSQVSVAGLPYQTSNEVEAGFPTRWLAVFNDRAEAEAWADGKPIAEIQPVDSGGSGANAD